MLYICILYASVRVSSGFIGYLPNIREMVSDWSGEDNDSDQLFFTKIYIDPAKKVSTALFIQHMYCLTLYYPASG